MTTSHSFTPFVPDDTSLAAAGLLDKAVLLHKQASSMVAVGQEARTTIAAYMAVINAYYSNLIEGNRTRPHEIRLAQQGEFASDAAKRDLQLESLAHIQVQQWLQKHNPSVNELFSTDCIRAIHQQFYSHVPLSLRSLKNSRGEVVDEVQPGVWRQRQVLVGQHQPPAAEEISGLMQQFCEIYSPNHYAGDKKIIAVMCAHHRFAWLHPFADGNGRVGRLFTDAALRAIGFETTGIWCLSRGLARASDRYKSLLAYADVSRQGDLDGRGELSQKALLEFCEFMLDVALDQVAYMNQLLQLDQMYLRIKSYVQARNDKRLPGMGAIKESAALILYHAFVGGKIDRALAIELSGMTERTARRLLAQMKEEGLITETSSRSPLYWQIPEHAEPWYFPQLTPF